VALQGWEVSSRWHPWGNIQAATQCYGGQEGAPAQQGLVGALNEAAVGPPLWPGGAGRGGAPFLAGRVSLRERKPQAVLPRGACTGREREK